jgi:hypothetical protein
MKSRISMALDTTESHLIQLLKLIFKIIVRSTSYTSAPATGALSPYIWCRTDFREGQVPVALHSLFGTWAHLQFDSGV